MKEFTFIDYEKWGVREKKQKVCPYCSKYKQCVLWKETNEWVCYDCRLDLLEQEFKEE